MSLAITDSGTFSQNEASRWTTTGGDVYARFDSKPAGTSEVIAEIPHLDTKPKKKGKPKKPSSAAAASMDAKSRAFFRSRWLHAKEVAAEMEDAHSQGDLFGKVNAARQLDDLLVEMWSNRDLRRADPMWSALVTHLTTALRQARLEGRLESLEVQQCRIFRSYVEELLGPGEKTPDDVHRAIGYIKDAGFNPYFAISGKPVL